MNRALLCVLFAGAAAAQTVTPTVNCIDASRPNLVYMAGSTAIRPFLGTLAQLLAADSPAYTVVYQSQGSCVGVSTVFAADPAARLIKDIPAANGKAANYAVFFKPDGSAQECFLDPAGNTVDVGASDVYSSTCGATTPAGVTIADYEGLIQPMTFVVPSASSQKNISAEAAYMVFGTGGNGGKAAPWLDQTFYFVRNASSGTQQMVARAIDVPADKWWGIDRGGSDAVRKDLKVLVDADSAEKAIGILSTDIVDDERSNLRVLAFQGKNQKCGYWPDSTPFATDKKNVRDGHYPIWGPEHFFTRTTGGLPSAAAAAVVTRFASPKLDQKLLDAIIAKHLVPKCAMKVKRTSEVGPLLPSNSDSPCGCYFDFKASGATSCQTCAGTTDCPASAPACIYGYCEAVSP